LSIWPRKLPFGGENIEVTQAFAREFPYQGNREFTAPESGINTTKPGFIFSDDRQAPKRKRTTAGLPQTQIK
jgi:hypothetical protein